MFNMQLVYKPPRSWRILFRSGGRPSQFSFLKSFRVQMVPGGGFHKGIIIQGVLAPTGILRNGHSCLIKKWDVTAVSVRSPRHRNNPYVQTVRCLIYKMILLEHTHSPIFWYERFPQGTTSWHHYNTQRYRCPMLNYGWYVVF